VRAFDSRIDNSPRQGFSQLALLARLEILRGARDSLADPEIRAEYNQGLAEDEEDTLILDVPLSKVRIVSFIGRVSLNCGVVQLCFCLRQGGIFFFAIIFWL